MQKYLLIFEAKNMRNLFIIICFLFVFNSNSQNKIDTLYINPKYIQLSGFHLKQATNCFVSSIAVSVGGGLLSYAVARNGYYNGALGVGIFSTVVSATLIGVSYWHVFQSGKCLQYSIGPTRATVVISF